MKKTACKIAVSVLTAAALIIICAIAPVKDGAMTEAERACRELIAEYNAAAELYEQERSEEAKTDANRACAVYNDYMFSYSSLWNGKVPQGIVRRLKEVN